MEKQGKIQETRDEFVEELSLTSEKIRSDMGSMKEAEGFPLGDDEDLLELSNPPYYTAYPNPYIDGFIKKYGRPYEPENDNYHREPFVGNVTEGKGDPYYNLHTYHTKVPYKAIVPFLEHYSEKDDIVLDLFCGSGMTGIACQELGRRSILLDLSPVSTFIASNINQNLVSQEFHDHAQAILDDVATECRWMFATNHLDKNGNVIGKGNVNYFVWVDIFECPLCGSEINIFKKEDGKLQKIPKCPQCSASLPRNLPRKEVNHYDEVLKKNVKRVEERLFLIEYTFNNEKYVKNPDAADYELVNRIEASTIPYWFPIDKMPFGYNTEQPRRSHHVDYVHQLYSKRTLWAYAALWDRILKLDAKKETQNLLLFWAESLAAGQTKLNRYFEASYSQVNRLLKGTLYIAPKRAEVSLKYAYSGKLRKITSAIDNRVSKGKVIVGTGSSSKIPVPDNSVDYIFTDPPFGGNLMYSELNFIWESWLKAYTDSSKEAIVNEKQQKDAGFYSEQMLLCFSEAYRVLKPQRWITVEFHNSQSEIWKVIQSSLVRSGFIVAQVSVLDKKQMTMKQYAYSTSVKNDLVIAAYKPSQAFMSQFLKKAGLNMERKFVKMHLDKLPVEPNVERTQQMLYSKLLAQYIQNGFEVRMDAAEFYSMLKNHFIECDGFWFNQEQIPEYEKRVKLKKSIGKFNLNQAILGISDEKSALVWLAQFLRSPRSYSDISIEFNKNLMTSQDMIPELKTMLEENFVTEGALYRLPSINEKKEKEDLRAKRLQKEFNDIFQEAKAGRKIKEVRKEALLHGLMEFYNKRAVDEIKILGAKLDSGIIESDDEIYAIIDWANTRGE